MGHLEWLERPEPGKDTILIAAFSGWNDAGDAATESAKYLRRRFRCHPVAHIDPEYFYDFASVRPSVQVTDGERKIDWPTPDVRIGEVDDGRPVVTVLGVEPRLRWRTFCDVIIEMANSLGVSTVVTLGALLTDTHHNAPVNVVGASNNTALNLNMGLRQSTYEGPTGIIGVLNDACHRAGFDSVSFWATVPTYVHNYPSPKAALALAERVGQFLGVTLGESELHSAAANYGRQIDELVAGDDTWPSTRSRSSRNPPPKPSRTSARWSRTPTASSTSWSSSCVSRNQTDQHSTPANPRDGNLCQRARGRCVTSDCNRAPRQAARELCD